MDIDRRAKTLWHSYDRRKDWSGPVSWMGSLIQHGRDPSGQLYRRNRYYDPSTGVFTQEDPIGLAGGINLYGFADGDPVSYSDPYGSSASACDPPRPGCPRVGAGGVDGSTGTFRRTDLGKKGWLDTKWDSFLARFYVGTTLNDGVAGSVSGKTNLDGSNPSFEQENELSNDPGASINASVKLDSAPTGSTQGRVSIGTSQHTGVTVRGAVDPKGNVRVTELEGSLGAGVPAPRVTGGAKASRASYP